LDDGARDGEPGFEYGDYGIEMVRTPSISVCGGVIRKGDTVMVPKMTYRSVELLEELFYLVRVWRFGFWYHLGGCWCGPWLGSEEEIKREAVVADLEGRE
jgi:hypothetical protein